MEAQEHQGQDVLADEVMHSLGEPKEAAHEIHESHEEAEPKQPENVDHAKALASAKKRLKAQSMSHERELREVRNQMEALKQQFSQPHQQASHGNPYETGNGNVDEQIHKAVSYALQHKELEEQKAREAESKAHVHRQYKELQKHLDNMGDRYDDFHDVVFGEDTKFTPAMRDYSMTLPKSGKGAAGEVLYHLGKNPQELERIGRLHPIDQASEMMKLSHALIAGGESKANQSARPLGSIKTNPVSNRSHIVTDKTPVGDIRARMKSGSWK